MSDRLDNILLQARAFSRQKFEKYWDPRYTYHNWDHTEEVASNAVLIGKQEGLTREELLLLEVAAIFHDLGHLTGYKNHEARSIMEVSDFLGTCGLAPESGRLIESAILSTKIPQSPLNNISRAMCDADLMYLAGNDFFLQAEQLRLEWQSSDRAHMDPDAFFRFSLDFLKAHRFHTAYGKTVLEEAKTRNLKLLEEMLENDSFNKHI